MLFSFFTPQLVGPFLLQCDISAKQKALKTHSINSNCTGIRARNLDRSKLEEFAGKRADDDYFQFMTFDERIQLAEASIKAKEKIETECRKEAESNEDYSETWKKHAATLFKQWRQEHNNPQVGKPLAIAENAFHALLHAKKAVATRILRTFETQTFRWFSMTETNIDGFISAFGDIPNSQRALTCVKDKFSSHFEGTYGAHVFLVSRVRALFFCVRGYATVDVQTSNKIS